MVTQSDTRAMFIDLSHSRWDLFFPDVCSIETIAEGETVNELGEVVPSRAPLLGHDAIGCAVEAKTGTLTNSEGEAVSVQSIEIGLRGYFPQVQAQLDQKRNVTAIIGAQRYRVLHAPSDSQHVKTRLIVEKTA